MLYLIVCAAWPALEVAEVVGLKKAEGYDVSVIATPTALRWLDVDAVEVASGHRVRHEWRRHDEPAFEPLGDEVLVYPATFNTINKWALGINDNLALGLLNEALSTKVPTTVWPHPGDMLRNHPKYVDNLRFLEDCGVKFLTSSLLCK